MTEDVTEYQDPDKEYESLDNDSYTDNLSETLKSRASSMETDQFDYDLGFDETSLKNVRDYIRSESEDEENDVDWLESDLDMQSEVDSWTTTNESEGVEYEIKEENVNKSDRCVIVDIINGNLVHCQNNVFRPLRQLVGIWELDYNSVDEIVKANQLGASHLLGVCSSHFNFDQKQLHNRGLKNSVPTDKSWIYKRRCLFCHNDKYFFSRGEGCKQHSWKVLERNVHIPCCGIKVCPIFTKNILASRSKDTIRARYICSNCLEYEGGHYYQRQGKGNDPYSCVDCHAEDNSMSLNFLGRWIQDVAASSDQIVKDLLLEELSSLLVSVFKKKSSLHSSKSNEQEQQALSSSYSNPNLPSFLAIKIALRLNKVNLTKMKDTNRYCSLFKKQSKELGEAFGQVIWNSRSDIRKNKKELEEPQCLEQYCDSFPVYVRNFFDGLVISIQKKKWEVVQKKRIQRELTPTDFNMLRAEKISIFLISTIFTISFPGVYFWLNYVMSSICKKPKLQGSLYAILCMANVVSHTKRHERRLAKKGVNIQERLIKGENVWNLCVIDNIDFREETFLYNNIFDAAGRTINATLRMVFQFRLPLPLSKITAKSESTNYHFFVGISKFVENELQKFEDTFSFLLNLYGKDFDIKEVREKLWESFEMECQFEPPNVVILEPGNNPNNTENIHDAVRMYFDDVGVENLEVACDEAIFRRLNTLNKTNVRPLLGAWHTSKAMCITLLTIFSGYGIYDLAAHLGVNYLDKLEKVIDYSATCHVLEHIWVIVGIALSQYTQDKNLTMKDIPNSNCNLLKVWYLFFYWAGFWLGHKTGIRYGHYDLQFQNLYTFAPLFPVAGRNNYAQSVTYFISTIEKDTGLQNILRYICSINLTRPGHCFAFDEALEQFGVTFIKQNIGSAKQSIDDLKLQIMSIQAERDHLNLLISEYINDNSLILTERNMKSRKDELWRLVANLKLAFEHPNSIVTDEFFKGATQNTEQGFQRLFNCYNIGVNRLHDIYEQDVKKSITRNTCGRRMKNIVTNTISQQKQQKQKRQQQNVESRQPKRQRKTNTNTLEHDIQHNVNECQTQ